MKTPSTGNYNWLVSLMLITFFSWCTWDATAQGNDCSSASEITSEGTQTPLGFQAEYWYYFVMPADAARNLTINPPSTMPVPMMDVYSGSGCGSLTLEITGPGVTDYSSFGQGQKVWIRWAADLSGEPWELTTALAGGGGGGNVAPDDITLTNDAVDENVPGYTIVGDLITLDPNMGDTFTYTLVSGIGDTDNASFDVLTISGAQLAITVSPDFETKSSYSIRLRSTDQDGLFVEKVFSITINDLPDGGGGTPGAFIATWQPSGGDIKIPIYGGHTYNYDLSWEEVGNSANNGLLANQTTDATITGLNDAKTYKIEITGDFPGIYLGDGDPTEILTVEQWGNIAWERMDNAFEGCINLTIPATDAPDLSNVTNLSFMFSGADAFNQSINHWDVSTVTDMSYMFWDTDLFSQSLNSWDVSSVTTMAGMFSGASAFNGAIGSWDVSSVIDMASMFQKAGSFNQDISSWNVGVVTNMSRMFEQASAFNQSIGSWNVSSVTDMSLMFSMASAFNQTVSGWSVGNVTNMSRMFNLADSFNKPIGGWNVSSVTNMSLTFYGASAFNQDLSGWDVSQVTDMSNMFATAASFNQSLGSWSLNSGVNLQNMLNNSGLGLVNYDATLTGWNNLPVSTLTLGAAGLKFCTAQAARDNLVNIKGWTIIDSGKDAACANADLSNLTISTGTLNPATFAAATISYSASLPYGTTSISVTPTVADNTATVKVNTVAATSGQAYQVTGLTTGTNTIEVEVTAQDGTTTKTYTLTATVQPPSTNADLSNLTISPGTLSSAFSSSTTGYTASPNPLPYGTTSISVTPTVTDNTATVEVNTVAATSGQPYQVTGLQPSPNTNTITVIVTAQDGTTTKTYTISASVAAFALPTASTKEASVIKATSANLGGNVASENGSPVTARGVVYSTTQNPERPTNEKVQGTGAGDFTITVTGLSSSKKYYVRAWAENAAGTAYGNQVDFTTPSSTPAPTGATAQSFCVGATVESLVATGTSGATIKWYSAASGGTALGTSVLLENAKKYYASQTVNGEESETRLEVTVTIKNTPTMPVVTVTQPTCTTDLGSITVTPQIAGETYYYGNTLNSAGGHNGDNPVISNLPAGDYWVIIATPDGCNSPKKTVTINPPPDSAPDYVDITTHPSTCAAPGSIEVNAYPTATYQYSFDNGKSFDAGNSINGSAAGGQHEVIVKSSGGCISPAQLTIIPPQPKTPPAPTTDNGTQSVCSGTNFSGLQVKLEAEGNELKWYSSTTSTTSLDVAKPLTNSATYYAAQVNQEGCASKERLPIKVTVNTVPAPPVPSATSPQQFCKAVTLEDIALTPATNLNWYSAATGGEPLLAGTALATGSYFASQTANGCESNRVEVKVETIDQNKKYEWKVIAAGVQHTLALKADGTLWVWGLQYSAVTSGVNFAKQYKPEPVGTDKDWALISASLHNLGIKTDGSLWAWGRNQYGSLGDGTNTAKVKPVQIGTDKDWVNISAGELYNLGIKKDGTLWAWGRNSYGQLGDGTNTDQSKPIQIGTDKDWADISAGLAHSLAIKTDGTLWAWGYNNGQLGDGTSAHKNKPEPIGTDKDWAGISAGHYHSLGIKKDGTLWAWGYNQNGQLGDGSSGSGTEKNKPEQIGIDEDWASISAGSYHSLSIKKDGTLWAWGTNYFGQLGDGTTTHRNKPVRIGIENDWASISGKEHSLGIKTDGTLVAWGRNYEGQLGYGTNTQRSSPFPAGDLPPFIPPVLTATTVAPPTCTVATGSISLESFSVGKTPTYSFDNGKTFEAEGVNSKTGLTPGDYEIVVKSAAGCLSPTEKVTISPQPATPLAPTTTSAAQSFCDKADFSNIKVEGTGLKWYDVATGGTAIEPITTPLVSGKKYYVSQTNTDGCESTGRLEISVNVNTTSAPTLPPLAPSSQVFCKPSTLADIEIQSTAKLNWYSQATGNSVPATPNLATGSYFVSQTANGCESPRQEVQVSVVDQTKAYSWKAIDVGSGYTLGIKTDGTLWAWGWNYEGQLGDGTNNQRIKPVQIGADKDWVSISVGWNHTLGLKENGTLWAWGSNSDGQLGNGTNGKGTDKNVPVQIGEDTDWKIISTGSYFSLGLKKDGTLWAWGQNRLGQLGNGTAGSGTDKNNPVKIGSGWASISAGNQHSLGIKTDGTLWAWGSNYNGQLGIGTIGSGTNKNEPIQIGEDKDWSSISCGSAHSLGIKKDKSLWAWGMGYYGQLGNGTIDYKNKPELIGSDKNWIQISTEFSSSYAIKEGGTLWAWGINNNGNLGDGSTDQRNTPVQIGMDKDWAIVFPGRGIETNGTLWAWGYNFHGELGDGTKTHRLLPVPIGEQPSRLPPLYSVIEVTQTTCTMPTGAIKINASVRPGDNFTYSFDNGSTFQDENTKAGLPPGVYQPLVKNKNSCVQPTEKTVIKLQPLTPPAPTGSAKQGDGVCLDADFSNLKVAGLTTDAKFKWYSSITGGTPFSEATKLTSGVTYYVSQTNTDGCESTERLAIAVTVNTTKTPTVPPTAPSPQVFCEPGSKLTKIEIEPSTGISWYLQPSGGEKLSASLTPLATGTFYATQTANGCESNRQAVQVRVVDQTNIYFWKSVAGGWSHSIGIKQDGSLWAWGDNSIGQLGDGTGQDSNSPKQIGTDKWSSVTVGQFHNLGIKPDGTLWAWGSNFHGRLGDGTDKDRSTPKQIGTGKWLSVAASWGVSLGINQDGSLWAWGDNRDAQLGNGDFNHSYIPIQISTDKWLSVSAGEMHCLGIKQDGTLWAWGRNDVGQLGDGTDIYYTRLPKQIGTDKWLTVAAGYSHSVGVKQDGTLWAWGGNGDGQLGDGTTQNSNAPKQIGMDKWLSVAAGYSHCVGVKQDGTLWAWGGNTDGRLGDGTTQSSKAPKQIGTDKWLSVASGRFYSLGLKQDGSLWAWGANESGQLGDGTNIDRHVPELIGGLPVAWPSPPAISLTQPTCNVLTGTITITELKSEKEMYSFDDGLTFQANSKKEGLPAATYSVVLKDRGGCKSLPAIAILEKSILDQPVITFEAGKDLSEPVLTSSDAPKYQWYKNETIISGATTKSYTVSENGSYTVKVISDAGCESVASVSVVAVITGDTPTQQPAFYPNPVNNTLFVEGVQSGVLHSVLGMDTREHTLPSSFEESGLKLYVKDLQAGVYILRLKDGARTHNLRFIKID